MKSKLLTYLVLIVVLVVAAGCSSSQPKYQSGVPMSSQMQESEFNPQVMVYRNPDVDIRQYKKVLLMPVEIYRGEDAEWKGADEGEKLEMAAYLQAEVQKVLQEKNLLATQPGPGVERLRLMIAGLEKTRPVASTVTHALPVGAAMNLGKGAMGKSGSFMGSATVGGEFTDSMSGALIVSFLAKENANAMDLPKVLTTWGASKKALDKVAEQIGDRVQKVQIGQLQ